MLALLAASLVAGNYGLGKHVWLVEIGAMVKMKKVHPKSAAWAFFNRMETRKRLGGKKS